jgi:hypothetical protein
MKDHLQDSDLKSPTPPEVTLFFLKRTVLILTLKPFARGAESPQLLR